MRKSKVRKGDNILVLSGKDKGKKGKVLKVISRGGELKIVVENIAIVKRHQKQTQSFQGGIIERPNAIPIAKAMVVCPRCGKPSRMGKVDGKRVCKKCGEVVDKA